MEKLKRRLDWRRYGGRKALLAYLARYTYWLSGGYGEYRKVHWAQVSRLVFVCRGNICRSVYAEYFSKAQGLPAASAGVETVKGRPADATTLKVAEDRNVEMADHRTTPIQYFDAKDGDLFIAMEPYQVEVVRRQGHWTAAHQVTLLGLWVDGHGAVLLDPYGQDEQSFAECFSVIEAGILVMKGRIAKE